MDPQDDLPGRRESQGYYTRRGSRDSSREPRTPRHSRLALRDVVAKAAHEMVVDETRRLHVRIDGGRADELEAASLQILAQRIGFLARRRHLVLLTPTIHARLTADEAPDVVVERAEFLLSREKCFRVRHGGLDLLAIAN